jgi:hypothetical protein
MSQDLDDLNEIAASRRDVFKLMGATAVASALFASAGFDPAMAQELKKAGKPLKANYDEFTKAAKLAADAELEYCNDEGFAWKPKCLENKVTLPEEHAVIEFDAEDEDGTKDLASFVDQLPAKQRRRL